MSQPKYDSTVARIAGNILSGMSAGLWNEPSEADARAVQWAVLMARNIVAETKRTEPVTSSGLLPPLEARR